MQKKSAIYNIPHKSGHDPGIQKQQAQKLASYVRDAHDLFQQLRSSRPDYVLLTPMLHSSWLSTDSTNVYIKLETEQITNAFKLRGALNRVHKALASGAKSVVTASTGNHAMAVTYALNKLGASGIVFLPTSAKSGKLEALQLATARSNVELKLKGDDCLEAELAALKYSKETAAVYVSPYNDLAVMAGQGTIGTEIMDYLSRDVDVSKSLKPKKCCYVTVGGGGLIAGIAASLKAQEPGVWRIVGCLPYNSPVMYECVKAGKVVNCQCSPTLSDGSEGDIEEGSITVEVCTNLVDAWALINEADIASAIRGMFVNHRKVVEGAAGVALAGFRTDKEWREQNDCKTAVVVACGANIDPDTFASIITQARGKVGEL